ncbi:MAG: 1,4-dihydroxy-6-naphthoate synthase [Bacteroidetes bacterium]|nr:1,4-dihydroxy-6-naphthoate synthase [Bacteroidota bacterium]
MKLRIGISPCPNDTFIFDAMYSKLIDISPFEFEFVFADVETLNQLAARSELDIIKLSYANYFNVLDNYIMLRSGGAMGEGVGPILIGKQIANFENISSLSVAIPGIHTTANFLLSYALPQLKNKIPFTFSLIEDAVLQGKTDLGVIIHENRFTYQAKGLYKWMDLGEYWEQKTKLPIPLGGIAIKRNMDSNLQQQINHLIKQSILFAQHRYPVLSDFITQHSQEMSEEVMKKHINLYVNTYSIEPGEKGIKAVEMMGEILHHNSQHTLFIN